MLPKFLPQFSVSMSAIPTLSTTTITMVGRRDTSLSLTKRHTLASKLEE